MLRKFAIITCAVLLAALAFSKANAQDQDTLRITVNAPLELPGMVIGPGTYDLRFIDDPGGSNVVEVRGENGKAYGLFPVRPVTQLNPAEHLKVDLQPEAGAPARVKDWFMAGATTGFEPIYPREHKATASYSGGSSAGY